MDLIYSLLSMLNEMSPYILLGFLIAGVMHSFIPQDTFFPSSVRHGMEVGCQGCRDRNSIAIVFLRGVAYSCRYAS